MLEKHQPTRLGGTPWASKSPLWETDGGLLMCCPPPPGKTSSMLWKPSEHFPNGFLEAKASTGHPDASIVSLRGEGWVWAALVTSGMQCLLFMRHAGVATACWTLSKWLLVLLIIAFINVDF